MKKLLLFLLLPFLFQAKPLRVGIAGMTHGHVGQVYTAIKKPQQDVIIVGFAESNKELAMSLLKKQNLRFQNGTNCRISFLFLNFRHNIER